MEGREKDRLRQTKHLSGCQKAKCHFLHLCLALGLALSHTHVNIWFRRLDLSQGSTTCQLSNHGEVALLSGPPVSLFATWSYCYLPWLPHRNAVRVTGEHGQGAILWAIRHTGFDVVLSLHNSRIPSLETRLIQVQIHNPLSESHGVRCV